VREVVTAVEQQPRAPRQLSGSLHGIPMTLVDEDEWIPDLLQPRSSRDALDRRLILPPMDQRTIRPRERCHSVPGIVWVSRVDGRRHPAVVDDAAAPATGSVDEPRPRRERDGMLLPAEQVGRADVTPMDPLVDRCHGVVLKEEVVAAVNPAQTIRVVQPALRRPDVQGWEAGIRHRAKGYCPGVIRSAETWRRLMLR
jgi:hypothetical protein